MSDEIHRRPFIHAICSGVSPSCVQLGDAHHDKATHHIRRFNIRAADLHEILHHLRSVAMYSGVIPSCLSSR